MKRDKGFTLLEILVALFIFTILAGMLTTALHNVIGTQDRTEKQAERLRKLQFALLRVARDVSQIVDRPVLAANGKEEKSFLGSPQQFTFTHTGLSNPDSSIARSNLQRTRYYWEKNTLQRMAWPVLDQAANTKASVRSILSDVSSVRFSYLDKGSHFYSNWPSEQNTGQVLPRAVKIEITLSDWGTISQLYVIPVQAKQNSPSTKPEATPDS